ncbi:transposase [Nitrosophilus labii]|uniref:transposase n=1 Tax=Nitrosophilus labii TaxID=2706014 RepID=UPI001657390D
MGLLILKQLENLSDENIVLQWKRNLYYQYFCGMREYQPAYPCDPTDLVYFRKHIGKDGIEKIFAISIDLRGNAKEEKQVIVDTTVQEKNITYPTRHTKNFASEGIIT